MQKRYPITAYADMESDRVAVTHAKAAVTRLAVERPLGARTFRKRAERLLLRFTQRGSWAYCGLVVALFLILQFEADRWWLGTAVMLAPKWPGLLPLAVLAPLALLLRARLLVPLAASSLIYVFGVLGLCVPWPWELPPMQPSNGITALSCNLDGHTFEQKSFGDLIRTKRIDVIALQESEQAFDPLFPEGWQVVRRAGLTLASRFPITDVQTWQRDELPQGRQRLVALYALIARPEHPIGICTVQLSSARVEENHLLTSEESDRASWPDRLQQLNYWRDRESEMLSEWIERLPQVDLIVGDFGMTVQSQVYRRWWARYENAFSRVGTGFGWTRRERLGKIVYGTRTDHALSAGRWLPYSCRVASPIGPGHLPVLVELTAEK